MASLHRDPRTKKWIIMFRFEGRQYRRSTDTEQSTKAQRIKGRVEDKIYLVKFGHLRIPEDADPVVWLMSDGKRKRNGSTNGHCIVRFENVCDAYLKDQVAKADTTLDAEQIHLRHMRKIFGNSTTLGRLNLDAMQKYVQVRRRQRYRGKTISGKTIRKELVTLTQLWSWARSRGHVRKECPIYGEGRKWAVAIPKPEERPSFQTWQHIEQQIKRNQLSEKQAKER